MIDPLAPALALSSSRLSPPPTPWRTVFIHAAVLVAWIALFSCAFAQAGILAWAVGIAYIVYDTLLQLFVVVECRRLRAPVATPSIAVGSPSDLGVGVGVDVDVGARLGAIVAAYNEATVLPATIAAMLGQTSPPDVIIVADDGSSDDTHAVLAAHYGLAPPPLGSLGEASPVAPALRWLRLAHGGKARALNAALVECDAGIVLTVDADTLLEPGAVAAVRAAFAAESELVAITGVITPRCKPTPGGRCLEWFQTYEYIRNFLSRYAWMQQGGLLLVSGAFAGFRRSALLDVGGFDAACLVEDYELIHRLRRHAGDRGIDWRVRVLGDAQARTEAPGSVGAFLRQRQRWFGGFLQTQYWYRSMVGDPKLGRLGTWMLPVKAIDTLQPLYGLTAFALLVFYVATGRFAIVAPVAAVIGAKVAVDLGFHLWSVHLYRRWVGDAKRASLVAALVAALAEPFTFQLLRHAGAALGWAAVVSRSRRWGRQTRFGLDR
ncbi:MAG TPA: glycosyltransferase family 2 protein [Caldimonas sp.]|nr:glycosyltransferase family 2 protein [Caldimonas sp.]